MTLDRRKIAAILHRRYAYYDKEMVRVDPDWRFSPSARGFLKTQFRKDFSVLDVGCGNGMTLLESARLFRRGVGIDNDISRLEMAKQMKRKMKVRNVTFELALSYDLPFGKHEFDLVFSERGPLHGASINIQAALRVLKPGGMVFSETLGERDCQEVNLFFREPDVLKEYQHMTVADEARVLFERNGVEIRLLNEFIGKMRFPDVYEWLKSQCNYWTYSGWPVEPLGDAERIERFARQCSIGRGEIAITWHRVWLGGIKRPDPPEYWEFKHFEK